MRAECGFIPLPSKTARRHYYKNFMPDRDYTFYLDGEYLPLEFDTKGAVIRFVMPERDVKLECRTKDSASQ